MNARKRCIWIAIALTSLGFVEAGRAQPQEPADSPAPAPQRQQPRRVDRPRELNAAEKAADEMEARLPAAITRGADLIVAMQEGEARDRWPYEGVYRVKNEIPIGYHVGGTAISASAIILAPGFEESAERRDAVARAARFVCDSTAHPLMNPDYDGGYDVRGWGYTYSLSFLLLAKAKNALPAAMKDDVEKTILFSIDAIEKTEIPEVGGWNYARPPGKGKVAQPSPFMIAPTLQALFEARAQGYEVKEVVVERALKALESSKTPTGSFLYSGDKGAAPAPGSIGRMVAGEATLMLAGRSNPANVRGALDAFLTHWEWMNQRRAQNGTHVAPYGIAPYYFYYAHYYAAQAVEMLPRADRREYRRRLNELLFKVQLEDGSWNDRVFPRSRNFGTSMSIMAMLMPTLPEPAKWKPAPADP